MLSFGAICFEDRFCASKKGGIGEGGRVSARGAVQMAAALAGCRKALVGTSWTTSHFVNTNRLSRILRLAYTFATVSPSRLFLPGRRTWAGYETSKLALDGIRSRLCTVAKLLLC